MSSRLPALSFAFLPIALFLCLVLSLSLAPAAHAQRSGVYVDISPCMDIENDAERYACYDRLLQPQEQEQEQQAPQAALPQDSVKQDDNEEAVAQFGKHTTASSQQQQANARILESDDGGQELLDTITQLKERTPNQWLITLSSGQVWMQVNSKRYRLQEGMAVRIYPSPFGSSFRLSATEHNGFIQVQRVQ